MVEKDDAQLIHELEVAIANQRINAKFIIERNHETSDCTCEVRSRHLCSLPNQLNLLCHVFLRLTYL